MVVREGGRRREVEAMKVNRALALNFSGGGEIKIKVEERERVIWWAS